MARDIVIAIVFIAVTVVIVTAITNTLTAHIVETQQETEKSP
jgi:hypothetical protein